jgi:exopolysaccharide biosynthesis polyprenyl glycosylphosphotransferase
MTFYIRRVVLALFADTLCLLAASAMARYLAQPPIPLGLYAAGTGVIALASLAALHYCDAYQPEALGSGRQTMASVLNAMGLSMVAGLILYFLVTTPPGAGEVLAYAAALYFPCFLVERLLFRFASSLPVFCSRILVIGATDLGVAIADAIGDRVNMGTEMVGFLSDDPDLQNTSVSGFPVLGKVHQIEKIMTEMQIEWIVVASKDRDEEFPAEVLLGGKLHGRSIESGVAFYERLTGRIYLRDLRPSYLIFSDGFQPGPLTAALKRGLDLSAALLGIVVGFPLFCLCAIAISLDSRGGVFYRQVRAGQDGRPFRIWKLRSMRANAEAQSGPTFSSENDARVTRVGRVLRGTRLDELPQLLNVLQGDMSLVGPRPERPEFVEELSAIYPYFKLRTALKPGITGWAQIRHGYVGDIEGFESKLALDLYYMKQRSFSMDLVILWQTVKTVALFRGV